MPRAHNIKTWDIFNRLTIIKEVNPYISLTWKKARKFLCQCECWIIKEIRLNALLDGNIRSCGCYNLEHCKTLNFKHWLSNNKLYTVFHAMKSRCENIKNPKFSDYWWRWIKCEWSSFEEFYNDMNLWYKKWLELDRIDNDWDYCKSNCRWATRSEQMRNTRLITFYNWKSIPDRCEELWLKPKTIRSRIHTLWWTIEKALNLI